MNNQDQLLIEAANILRRVDETTIDNAKARYKVTGSSRGVGKRLKQLKKLAKTDPATAIKEYDKALSELKALRKQADKIENDSRALIILVDEAKFLAGAAASLLFLKGVQKATKANSLDLLKKAMTHDEDSKEYADAMRSMQTRAYMRNYSSQASRAVTIGEIVRAAYSSICAIKSAIKGEVTDRNRKSALEAVDKVIAACEKAKREAARKLKATKSAKNESTELDEGVVGKAALTLGVTAAVIFGMSKVNDAKRYEKNEKRYMDNLKAAIKLKETGEIARPIDLEAIVAVGGGPKEIKARYDFMSKVQPDKINRIIKDISKLPDYEDFKKRAIAFLKSYLNKEVCLEDVDSDAGYYSVYDKSTSMVHTIYCDPDMENGSEFYKEDATIDDIYTLANRISSYKKSDYQKAYAKLQRDPSFSRYSANDSEANIVEAAHILNAYCGNAEVMNEATLVERYKSVSALRSAAKEFNDRVKHAESDKHLKFACNEFKKKLAAAKKDVEKMSDNDVARYVAKYVARVGVSMIASAIGISISMRMLGMGANSQIAKLFRSVAAPAAGASAAVGTTISAITDTISGNGTTKKECLNLIDKMSATCDQIASLGIENLKKAKKLARKLKRESKGHHAVDIY